jgi:hypothetical protein
MRLLYTLHEINKQLIYVRLTLALQILTAQPLRVRSMFMGIFIGNDARNKFLQYGHKIIGVQSVRFVSFSNLFSTLRKS